MKRRSSGMMAMKLYRLVLQLYPRRFKAEYQIPMAQHFRDQWREARDQGGWMTWAKFYIAQIFDLCATLVREHCAEITHSMKTQAIAKLSLALLVGAVACHVALAPMAVASGWAPICLYLSLLLLAARAFAEWHRHNRQWRSGLGWAVVVLLLYGLILPFWFRMHLIYGSAYPSVPALSVSLVILNAFVPIMRVLVQAITYLAGWNRPAS